MSMKVNAAVCASCIVPVARAAPAVDQCTMQDQGAVHVRLGESQNAASSGLNLRQRRGIVVNQ
jgi:hypothetical protein